MVDFILYLGLTYSVLNLLRAILRRVHVALKARVKDFDKEE